MSTKRYSKELAKKVAKTYPGNRWKRFKSKAARAVVSITHNHSK